MRRFAWALGVLGALLLVTGASAAWALGSVDGRPTWLLVGGAALLIAYVVLDRETLGAAVSSKGFIHGGSSALLVALAFTAAAAGYALVERHDKTWDLTRERTFTLSDHTVRTLTDLSEPVEVLAFFRNDSEEQRAFRGLIGRMAEHTPQLQVTWIDPLRQPRQAEANDVSSDRGVVILKTADDRSQRLDGEITEEVIVQRLVLLLSRTEHRICWAMGHGEPDPDDEFGERGLGAAVIQLEALNYQVVRQMVPSSGIDRACEALVIARPTVDWVPWEREALAAYLAEGGRVFMLLEPDSPPDLTGELDRYGIGLRADVVLDVNPQNQLMGVDDPSFVVLHGHNLLSHPITANLGAAVVLPIARSVSAESGVEGLTVQRVLQTSEQAWGETSADPTAMVQPDPGEDLIGEVPVMVVARITEPEALHVLPHDALEPGQDPLDPTAAPGRAVPEDLAPKPGGRLAVIGDADFAANGYLALGNNRDLFLNTIAWLVEEEKQIGERPSAGDTLAIDDLSAAVLCLVSVVFVPGAVALLAVLTAWRRRSL